MKTSLPLSRTIGKFAGATIIERLLADIKGHEIATRGTEVAAAGGDKLLMIYPVTFRSVIDQDGFACIVRDRQARFFAPNNLRG